MTERILVYGTVWFLIAFPCAFARSSALSHGGSWSGGLAGVVAITALAGVGGSSFVVRRRALAGALVGLGLSGVLLLVATPSAVRMSTNEALYLVMWNGLAGGISGELAERTWTRTGVALAEADLGWIAGALWIPVLRLSELATPYRGHIDTLFWQEVLTFVPVLLWSGPATKRLLRHAKGTGRQLVLRSMLCAFLVQELSALSLFPIALLVRGRGGTEEAVLLLGGVPGPGIVWGVLVAWLLRRTRGRETQPAVSSLRASPVP